MVNLTYVLFKEVNMVAVCRDLAKDILMKEQRENHGHVRRHPSAFQLFKPTDCL